MHCIYKQDSYWTYFLNYVRENGTFIEIKDEDCCYVPTPSANAIPYRNSLYRNEFNKPQCKSLVDVDCGYNEAEGRRKPFATDEKNNKMALINNGATTGGDRKQTSETVIIDITNQIHKDTNNRKRKQYASYEHMKCLKKNPN